MNILVTGGASGLGEAITRKLSENSGFRVYFTYASSVDQARHIESEYTNATAIKCDFRNLVEVLELTDRLENLNIDVLINNAYTGDFLKSHFHKTPTTDFTDAFNDNVLPTLTITQGAIKAFRKKKSGKIITILTAALVNIPPVGSAVYTANKAYLEQLTKIWATENTKFNITSNTVSPAFMRTGFTESIDERVVEQIRDSHPLKRLLTTEEVAESVAFLVSSSRQINGVNLIMNAGMDIK